MLEQLRKFLTPPAAGGSEEHRLIRLQHIIILLLIVFTLLLFFLYLFIAPMARFGNVLIIAALGVEAGSYWL